MKVSKTGYKKNSKDKNQPSLLIPSNQITMKGVEFPVLGTDNTGYSQMMYPGLDYSFPGSYVYELPMAQGGGHIVPGRYRNPEGNWLNKYDNGGPRIDKLPIQQVDGKVEIAYDGSTVYVRKIGDEKFASLSPEKSKAFLQKYQGFIPPTLTQVEEQKKKQQAYNAKIAKEKKEFDELRKIDTTPNPREKQMMIELAKKQRAELSEKGFLEQAWDALPDASSITDPIAKAYHALPDVGDVTKGVSTLLNLPEDIAKAGATYLWNSYKIPETEIPGLRQFGELTPREIYESFQNRYVEKNFGEAGLIGESNLEEFNVLDETSGTSNMQELPRSRAKYGPQRLPGRKDSAGNLLPAYQPIGGNDSLARFSYTFNNDIAGADSLPPTHFVTPKIKELTGNPARPRKWDNAFAVGDFLRDADITENQFYHPDKYYVGTSNSALRNSDLGIKSNKLISASNQLSNDPEKYWAVYKWDPKNPEAAWVRYMKTDEIKSKKDELEKQGWSLDMPVSGQHRFDDVDWEGKGSDTGYKADSEWVPLKKGAKQIKSQKGVNHTYIPQGTRKGQDKGTYNLFSGGSITFIWKDPETNERLASTLAGSVSDMKSYGEKLKKDYGLSEGDLEIVYHDTGSYSAKPAAKDGTLYYDQWKNYNAYNKGYSGAALIVPTEDWLENWTPSKKDGGQLDQYQKRGEVHQKIYTDSKEFAKANKLYNDSLDLYTKSLDFHDKNIPMDDYDTFAVPYDDVHWTADGPGGYFIDGVLGGTSQRFFLGKNIFFNVPGSEGNKIFTESFTNKIKPIGFDTVSWPYPVYKKPTEEPVYEQLKNLTPLDARLQLPEVKLNIGKPAVKSQGIRIKPIMTADQNTRTGQYQSGKYMWDPNTKSWKVQMLSPETQRENREEVKLKSKKNGGWLDQYQDGSEAPARNPLSEDALRKGYTWSPEFGTMAPEVEVTAERPYELVNIPGGHGMMTTAKMYKDGTMEYSPETMAAMNASNEIARSNNVDPITLGFAAGASLPAAGRLLGTKLFGTGISANNIINPYFIGKGISEVVNSNSDYNKAASAFFENPSENWRPFVGESLLTSLNFAGAASLPKDARAILKSSIVRKPISKLLSYIPDKRKLTPELYRQHAIEVDNAIRTEGHKIIDDLSSKEGASRLKEQFRKADPTLTEDQLNYLVVNRISEVNTALQKNTPRFYLEKGAGAEGTYTHGAESEFFPRENAYWTGYNPYAQFKDIIAMPRSADVGRFPPKYYPHIDSKSALFLAKRAQFTEPSYMPGTISVGTGYPNKTRVIRHEAAHATQGPGAGNLPLEDDLLSLVKPSSLKDYLRHGYKYLTDPKYSGDYKYFTGKNNHLDRERYAFLAENRSKMKDVGIIDDTYSKIDYGKLEQAARDRRSNPSGDNRFINLFPSWKWNKLADIMNVAPSMVPAVGVGLGTGIGLGLYKNAPERKTTYATFKSGGWLDKYQGDEGSSQVERRDPNQPFFPSATEQDMYESQYSQPEVTITPDWTEAELERNRLRDEYIKKDKNVFRHWYDKLGYDKDNVTKRANQFAYNKLAKEYLKGDKDKLTPEQRKFIEKSEYANRLQPSVGERFVEGVTNPGFNMETVTNVLAPFEYPSNLVRGAVTGEFADAVKGQTPSPYFVSSDLAGTSPSQAAIASGLMTVGTDPLFLTGDEVFQGIGKGAKGLRKFFTKPSATKVPSKPLNEITADVDALNATIKPRSEATTEDMQSLLDRLQSINRSLEEHIDPNSLEDLDDMSFDPSITDDISSVDPDIYKSMKDRLKGLERNIQNDEAARDREMDKILDKEVPQEFMVEARAAGAKGPEKTGFFNKSEINEKLAQYQDYLEKRKYFDDMYPEDPGNMIMDIFSGGADREAREQLFENLFPNAKKPNWWGKEYRPEDRAYLTNKLKYEPDTPFHKFNDKTSEMGLKGLLNFEKQTNTQLPTQKYISQVEQEMSDPASWYNTNPKDFVMEFRGQLNLDTKYIDSLNEQELRELAEDIQIARIRGWKESLREQLNQKGPKPDITLPPERLNKYGGSIKWLDKYQDGGSREMPLGLPLREQNPYLLPEYNQPIANGYILPDPNRPQLLNTGATEYKYSYGMDDRDVQVPSVVAGQYIGDKAFDRYMISGEEFKPMADPSSYSKYYDMLMELGLMQKKKGGEPYPSLGYFEYIGGYRGVSS